MVSRLVPTRRPKKKKYRLHEKRLKTLYTKENRLSDMEFLKQASYLCMQTYKRAALTEALDFEEEPDEVSAPPPPLNGAVMDLDADDDAEEAAILPPQRTLRPHQGNQQADGRGRGRGRGQGRGRGRATQVVERQQPERRQPVRRSRRQAELQAEGRENEAAENGTGDQENGEEMSEDGQAMASLPEVPVLSEAESNRRIDRFMETFNQGTVLFVM